MRILFITNRYPTPDAPGSSPAIEQQRRALQQLGQDVDLLFIKSEKSRLEYLKAMWRVFCFCQVQRAYDVVHAHFGYCGLVAAMQRHCPVVVTFRGSDVMHRRQRPLSRLAAKLADRSIVMTEEMRQMLGRPAEVIPYGIDLEIFMPRDRVEARRELGLPAEVPIVLFPYDPRRAVKRFDLVEEAIGRVKANFPEVQLLALHDKPPATLAVYMNAADAMVLASDREGSPSAVREAMACNLAIVSVDVGDVADIIRETSGCHIAERTPADIAEKLASVLHSRRRTNGRSAVREKSTLRAASRLTDIYSTLVRQGRGRHRGECRSGDYEAIRNP